MDRMPQEGCLIRKNHGTFNYIRQNSPLLDFKSNGHSGNDAHIKSRGK